MDPLESYNVAILCELGKLLRLHKDTHPCFYALSFHEDHPFSLSNYLMLPWDELRGILIDSGMAYCRGCTFVIKATKFHQFLEYQGLRDHYFDQMEVTGITKHGKQEWWLRLGEKETPQQWKPFTPSKQFKVLKHPPKHKVGT